MPYNDSDKECPTCISFGNFFVDEDFEPEKGCVSGPERALMTALLFDGVLTCVNSVGLKGQTSKRSYREAMAWVNTHDDDYIFSFENICSCLGIDADSLRIGLLNALNSKKKLIKDSNEAN